MQRERWSQVLRVIASPVRCPHRGCGAGDPIRVKSRSLKTGLERWYTCKRCSRQFVWEFNNLFPIGESAVFTDRDSV